MIKIVITKAGDKDAKTKPSKHTKKFDKMYGKEAYEIGADYANHTKEITTGGDAK